MKSPGPGIMLLIILLNAEHDKNCHAEKKKKYEKPWLGEFTFT